MSTRPVDAARGALRGAAPPAPRRTRIGAALLLALTSCAQYRAYPPLGLETPGRAPLEPTGVVVLDDGLVVAIAEGEADALLVPEGGPIETSGSALTLLPLTDGAAACDDPACRARAYRAGVKLRKEPIRWLPREKRVTTPFNVEDLASFGPNRVLGVTAYETIGRKTGFRKDYVSRPRRQTERLFALERRESGEWQEVLVPEIERLRGALSDWGRGSCDGDMRVEGLAWDPLGERAYIGLRRCAGPVQRVLGWDLGSARRGRVADLVVVADGLDGVEPGPEEGVSGLDFARGRLWALTAWSSYGHEAEPAFGGRLHEVVDGKLRPVDLPDRFVDRPSALAVLPSSDPAAGLDALVAFDNDADARARPELTVLQTRTPRPKDGRYAELLAHTAVTEAHPLALNGFDFRWWIRDHRLGHLAAVLDRRVAPDGDQPGAWTRALGGLWQMRVGASFGLASRFLPGKVLYGHNKQAVAFTDFSASGLTFTSYRAQVSVIPRDRIRGDTSLSGLLDAGRDAWRVTVPLPDAVPEGALVLQGFEIDTSSRADRGICVAALELGVSWHSEARDAVDLQTTLVGGVCNDFDARGPDYFHGLTTAVDGGVLVTLHYAIVTGAPSSEWGVAVFDKAPPRDPKEVPERDTLRDHGSRAHLHCVSVGADGAVWHRPRDAYAPPESWLAQDDRVDGTPVVGPVALRGFALALDPVGFDAAAPPRTLTDADMLGRNHYVYRYLLRVLPEASGTFVEGGISHGIHLGGPMRDSARPSALALRADLTSFPGLAGAAAHDIIWPRAVNDPNLLPEDGYVRWSTARPAGPEARCSPRW